MNKEIKTTVFFHIDKQGYKAEQKFPSATWHISEECSEHVIEPGFDGFRKSYNFIIDVTCKSRNVEKIKAAFLALDECPDD